MLVRTQTDKPKIEDKKYICKKAKRQASVFYHRPQLKLLRRARVAQDFFHKFIQN